MADTPKAYTTEARVAVAAPIALKAVTNASFYQTQQGSSSAHDGDSQQGSPSDPPTQGQVQAVITRCNNLITKHNDLVGEFDSLVTRVNQILGILYEGGMMTSNGGP